VDSCRRGGQELVSGLDRAGGENWTGREALCGARFCQRSEAGEKEGESDDDFWNKGSG